MDGRRREVRQAECASNRSVPRGKWATGGAGTGIGKTSAATRPPETGLGNHIRAQTCRNLNKTGDRARSGGRAGADSGRNGFGGHGQACPPDPGRGHIRSIIALPKPEHETWVAPCISRAKS